MLGAYLGEIIDGNTAEKALKPAIGSLIGFFTSIILRSSLSIIMAYFFFTEVLI
jgi:uncharacterized protein YqgC (DUF456 family)